MMKKLHENGYLVDILNTHKLFDCIRHKEIGGGSYYCGRSPSGGKHEINITLLKILRINLSPPYFNDCEDPSEWNITYPNELTLQVLAK